VGERSVPSLLGLLVLALVLPVSSGGQAPDESTPLRLGVVSFYNPRLMFVRYQPLVDYLGERTGRPWELAVSGSYEQATDDLCAGRVTLASLGPLTYLRAHARCGAVPLLRLQGTGGGVFHGDVLVRSDSRFERIEDLVGHAIGFGDPLSTSSHLLPRAMLQAAGLEPGRDFECRYFGQHERAARAVLVGEVAACGVRDSVGEIFLHRGLRRLARSAPAPTYPLVASPLSSRDLQDAVVAALLGFPGETRPPRSGVRPDLELAGTFGPASDAEFDGVRRLASRVFGPDYARLAPEELQCP
jgi:phosphonate transport system substrate-binding protein